MREPSWLGRPHRHHPPTITALLTSALTLALCHINARHYPPPPPPAPPAALKRGAGGATSPSVAAGGGGALHTRVLVLSVSDSAPSVTVPSTDSGHSSLVQGTRESTTLHSHGSRSIQAMNNRVHAMAHGGRADQCDRNDPRTQQVFRATGTCRVIIRREAGIASLTDKQTGHSVLL